MPAELSKGLDKYQDQIYALNRTIEKYQHTVLMDMEAKTLLLNLFSERVGSLKCFYAIVQGFYGQEEPRSLWTLHNACTSAFKSLPPGPQFTHTIKLARYLESLWN